MKQSNLLRWLIIGDVIAILIVSLIGFLSHYGEVRGWRWLTTFFPVLAGWFLIAPWLGVYRAGPAMSLKQVWRPGLAAFLSAPTAAWLRGLLLGGAAISPVFVGVLGLTDALGFLIWRSIWVLIANRTATNRTETNG
ncbi:MAG: DUF3054 domain-containing protein [Chloroflexi bacterium]|nr:DUF3054 domain-containing protein [Chloroflexota bacterium]